MFQIKDKDLYLAHFPPFLKKKFTSIGSKKNPKGPKGGRIVWIPFVKNLLFLLNTENNLEDPEILVREDVLWKGLEIKRNYVQISEHRQYSSKYGLLQFSTDYETVKIDIALRMT